MPHLSRSRARSRIRATSARWSILAPSPVGLIGLALLSLAYLLIGPRTSLDADFNINLVGPLVYVGLMGYEAIALVRRSRSALLTPIFAFYGSTAIYFGFGSISPLVTNKYTREYLFQLGIFGDAEMLKFNLIVTVFTFIMLTTIAVHQRLVGPSVLGRSSEQEWPLQRGTTLFFALAALAGGLAAEWAIFLPSQLGLFSTSVPALFTQLINLVYVGIFLLTFWCLRYRPTLVWFPLLLTLLESGIGLILLTKQGVLLPAMFFALAVAMRAHSLFGTLAPICAVALIFNVVAPIVNHGRMEQELDYGAQIGASLGERVEYVSSYFETNRQPSDEDALQYNWVRISYINWGISVIEKYDIGQPGDTLTNLFYVLVPRAIWPEKPQMATVGTELYTLMTGQHGVSVSAGLFAEAYWNFGWVGGFVLVVPYSLLLSGLSRFALGVLAREDWIYMPAVMLSVRMGTRPDGLFILDVFGAGVLIFGFIAVAWTTKVLLRRARGTVAPSGAVSRHRFPVKP